MTACGHTFRSSVSRRSQFDLPIPDIEDKKAGVRNVTTSDLPQHLVHRGSVFGKFSFDEVLELRDIRLVFKIAGVVNANYERSTGVRLEPM